MEVPNMSDQQNLQIGVIGLGNMGGSVAESILHAGYCVHVYDIDPEPVQRLTSLGAKPCNTLQSMCQQAHIIFTSLPNSPIVQRVYDDLLQALRPQTIFVELSTIDPETTRSINKQLTMKSAYMIDLPVSGSPDDVRNGKAVLLAGGNQSMIEEINPILRCIGEKIHYVGQPGDAKVVKIVNNLMSMANVAAAAEAFTLGVKAGIDPELLYHVLSQSGGRSHHFNKRFAYVLERDFHARFSMQLGEKDVGLGLELSKKLGVPTPISSIVGQMYGIAMAEGMAAEDIVSIVKLYEKWGGVVTEEKQQ
jgi:3-hydroxyisobutyrate dehydrogenase-like beta-hydroxyacid dehydrogenase